jgi:hypothetical protein
MAHLKQGRQAGGSHDPAAPITRQGEARRSGRREAAGGWSPHGHGPRRRRGRGRRRTAGSWKSAGAGKPPALPRRLGSKNRSCPVFGWELKSRIKRWRERETGGGWVLYEGGGRWGREVGAVEGKPKIFGGAWRQNELGGGGRLGLREEEDAGAGPTDRVRIGRGLVASADVGHPGPYGTCAGRNPDGEDYRRSRRRPRKPSWVGGSLSDSRAPPPSDGV